MGLISFLKNKAGKNTFTDTVKNIQAVFNLVNDPKLSKTYYPELPGKSKHTILWENVKWVVKHKEVNVHYYLFGFDRKNPPTKPEIIPFKTFNKIRTRNNLHPNKESYNYRCITKDKFVFSQFLSSLGFAAPKNLALVNSESLTWLNNMKSMPLTSLIEDQKLNINGFCKKMSGQGGEGAFAVKIKDSKLYIKEKEVTLDEFKKKISDGDLYLLQERIIQHPKMSELHPDSVNSIRIITFNNNGKVEVFSAAIRIGSKGSSVDNWAKGAIAAGIDLDTGKLKSEGFFKPGYGGRVEKHPDTGVTLRDFEIPFFSESVRLTLNLHTYLYGIHSIGWDIAITENGPVFIEGNDAWGRTFPMLFEKNYYSRFLEMSKS